MLKAPRAKQIGRDFNLRRFCVQLLHAKTTTTTTATTTATSKTVTQTTTTTSTTSAKSATKNVAHVNP